MKKIQCIYSIQNILNNKQYIGSTVDYISRKRVHLSDLVLNKHHSIFLQRSWNKYGSENFRFFILENNIENLIEREQYWIDLLKPKYNMCKIAGSPLGFKHTKEFCDNVRIRMLGTKASKESLEKRSNTISGEGHWTFGKENPFSDNHKKNLSISRKLLYKNGFVNPMLGRKHTDESLLKIKNSRKTKSVLQYDKDMNFIKKYNSAKEAADELNISYVQLCSVARGNGKVKTAGGCIWIYG